MCVLLTSDQREILESVMPPGLTRVFLPHIVAGPMGRIHERHLSDDSFNLVSYFNDLGVDDIFKDRGQRERFERFLATFERRQQLRLRDELRVAIGQRRPVQFALLPPDGSRGDRGPRVEGAVAATGAEHVIVVRLDDSTPWARLKRTRRHD